MKFKHTALVIYILVAGIICFADGIKDGNYFIAAFGAVSLIFALDAYRLTRLCHKTAPRLPKN